MSKALLLGGAGVVFSAAQLSMRRPRRSMSRRLLSSQRPCLRVQYMPTRPDIGVAMHMGGAATVTIMLVGAKPLTGC